MNHGGSQAINHQRVEGTSLKSCVANIAFLWGISNLSWFILLSQGEITRGGRINNATASWVHQVVRPTFAPRRGCFHHRRCVFPEQVLGCSRVSFSLSGLPLKTVEGHWDLQGQQEGDSLHCPYLLRLSVSDLAMTQVHNLFLEPLHVWWGIPNSGFWEEEAVWPMHKGQMLVTCLSSHDCKMRWTQCRHTGGVPGKF